MAAAKNRKVVRGSKVRDMVDGKNVTDTRCVLICVDDIAGAQYAGSAHILRGMSIGDKVDLIREPRNVHDAGAVLVMWTGIKLGYVPKEVNQLIGRLLDGGYGAFGVIVGKDGQAEHLRKYVKVAYYLGEAGRFRRIIGSRDEQDVMDRLRRQKGLRERRKGVADRRVRNRTGWPTRMDRRFMEDRRDFGFVDGEFVTGYGSPR
jgi:hypothetical protein